VRPSMGSAGDAYDNAMCESFFATLECELLDRRRFKTHKHAKDQKKVRVVQGRQRRYIKGQKYTLLSRRENLTLDRIDTARAGWRFGGRSAAGDLAFQRQGRHVHVGWIDLCSAWP